MLLRFCDLPQSTLLFECSLFHLLNMSHDVSLSTVSALIVLSNECFPHSKSGLWVCIGFELINDFFTILSNTLSGNEIQKICNVPDDYLCCNNDNTVNHWLSVWHDWPRLGNFQADKIAFLGRPTGIFMLLHYASWQQRMCQELMTCSNRIIPGETWNGNIFATKAC